MRFFIWKWKQFSLQISTNILNYYYHSFSMLCVSPDLNESSGGRILSIVWGKTVVVSFASRVTVIQKTFPILRNRFRLVENRNDSWQISMHYYIFNTRTFSTKKTNKSTIYSFVNAQKSCFENLINVNCNLKPFYYVVLWFCVCRHKYMGWWWKINAIDSLKVVELLINIKNYLNVSTVRNYNFALNTRKMCMDTT